MKQNRVKPSYLIMDNNSPEALSQWIRKILVEKLLLRSDSVTRPVKPLEERGSDK